MTAADRQIRSAMSRYERLRAETLTDDQIRANLRTFPLRAGVPQGARMEAIRAEAERRGITEGADR